MYLVISIIVAIIGIVISAYVVWKINKPAPQQNCVGDYSWWSEKEIKNFDKKNRFKWFMRQGAMLYNIGDIVWRNGDFFRIGGVSVELYYLVFLFYTIIFLFIYMFNNKKGV